MLCVDWLSDLVGSKERNRRSSRKKRRRSVLPAIAEVLEDRTLLTIGFLDPNPSSGNRFGETVVPLSSGNVVVTAPGDDSGGVDAGAVYLFDGETEQVLYTLFGQSNGDQIGSDGVHEVGNGNFIVRSGNWNSGRGAVTFGSGVNGIDDIVDASNSLVGSSPMDRVGRSTPDDAPVFFDGVFVLSNGNYLVNTPFWTNGSADAAGAVTFGNGEFGITGTINSSNSLVGSQPFDFVGGDNIVELANGNYVVRSGFWKNGSIFNAGAVTWGSGTSGVTGPVSVFNSLVGSTDFDNVGGTTTSNVVPLTNGHYVVASGVWDNLGIPDAGAATWGDGTRGVTGIISSQNSLVGSAPGDQVGRVVGSTFFTDAPIGGVVPLSNGNYVVSSPAWDRGFTPDAGAATFGRGVGGITGFISSANSLVGSSPGDRIGIQGIVALANGNYVVASPTWTDQFGQPLVGAVTHGNGNVGTFGNVSSANSLVGSQRTDTVGAGGTVELANGNYVIISPFWNNGSEQLAGAVTFSNGNSGITGAVSSSNSLVGGNAGDNVGFGGVTPLTNGNYVVTSRYTAPGESVRFNTQTFEENGAIQFATNTGITGPGQTAVIESFIGDGFYGFTTGDYDWFRVDSVSAGDRLLIDVDARALGSPLFAGVSVYDQFGNRLAGAATNNEDGDTTLAFDAFFSGTYYVVVSGFFPQANPFDPSSGAGAVSTGNYRLNISNLGTATAPFVNPVDRGTPENGSITLAYDTGLVDGQEVQIISVIGDGQFGADPNDGDPFRTTNGDIDWYRVRALSAGDRLVVEVDPQLANSPLVPKLDIYDQNGNLLNSAAFIDTDEDGDNSLTYVVPSNVFGTRDYYIVISGVGTSPQGNINDPSSGQGTSTRGPYRLSFRLNTGGRGAVTFGNGNTGRKGVVSQANSLVGNRAGDMIGSGGVVALSNGNYVISSPNWTRASVTFAGAATFGNGTNGISGLIDATNSLVGSTPQDHVGGNIVPLGNGNYVVTSFGWDRNGIPDAGAATFGNGSGGISGAITPLNSLVGASPNDHVGTQVAVLSNNNYVVVSPDYDSGGLIDAGAATFGLGTTGVVGEIHVTNSAIGETANTGLAGVTGFDIESFGFQTFASISGIAPNTDEDQPTKFFASFPKEGGGLIRVGSELFGFAATLNILDASVVEGDSGSTALQLRVVLDRPAGENVTFDINTVPDTAEASDFVGGNLLRDNGTIPAGQLERIITLQIQGDTNAELNEQFHVDLSNFSFGTQVINIAGMRGTGTITNDDAATLSISDAVADEDTGTISFDLALSHKVDVPITVNYSTDFGTANADDFTPVSNGTVNFGGGELFQTVTINLSPDFDIESDENFFVNLSNLQVAGRPVTILDGQARGTIRNDDDENQTANVTLSINDVSADENSGQLVFTVSLSRAVNQNVSVNYVTVANTATANDFTAANGTLTIPAGQTSRTIAITVSPDSTVEPNERFFVDLSNPRANGSNVNVTIADNRGIGTIQNDDSNGGGTNPVTRGSGQIADQPIFSGAINGTYQEVVSGDFDGSSNMADDLLFWDPVSGRNRIVLSDGTILTNPFTTVLINGNDFTTLLAGNFDGGGRTDLFFWNPRTGRNRLVHTTGSVLNLQGSFETNVIQPPAINGNDFTSVVAGNLNGAGVEDLFFWNPRTGRNRLAHLTTVTPRANTDVTNIQTNIISPLLLNGNAYQTVQIGQFIAGGLPELLFMNLATGQNRIVTLNAAQPGQTTTFNSVITNLLPPSAFNGSDFEQIAIGDFNGDGIDDVFAWGSRTGRNRFAIMNGTNSPTIVSNVIDSGAINGEYQRVIRLTEDVFSSDLTDEFFFWDPRSGRNRLGYL